MTASDYLVVERLEAKVEELRAEIARLRAEMDQRMAAYIEYQERDEAEIERLNESELLHAIEMVNLEQRIGQQEVQIERLRALVNEQAEDEGLWFRGQTCAEAYVQQALRRLHAAIEGKSPEECARRAMEPKP